MNSGHEAILIEGLKEGNVKIFDFVFHYYYSGMVVFAMKYLYDKNLAEDLVQNFFVKLWIKQEQIEIKQSLKSFFYTSVKNSCIDYLRQQKSHEKVHALLIKQLHDEDDAGNLLVESELRDQINNAINKLPPACRDVFILNRFEGMKPTQIADVKNISVRTVEKHIGNALKALKNELSAYLPNAILVILLTAI